MSIVSDFSLCATYYLNQRQVDLYRSVDCKSMCYRVKNATNGILNEEKIMSSIPASWKNSVIDLTGYIIREELEGIYVWENVLPTCEWKEGDEWIVYLIYSAIRTEWCYQLFHGTQRNEVYQGVFNEFPNMDPMQAVSLYKNLFLQVINHVPVLSMPWYWSSQVPIKREANWTMQCIMGDQPVSRRDITLRLLSIGIKWVWEAVLAEERFASRLPVVSQEEATVLLPVADRIQNLIESSLTVKLDKYGRLTSVESSIVVEQSRINKRIQIDRFSWAVTAVLKKSSESGFDPRSLGHLAIMIESVEKWNQRQACYRRQLADIRVGDGCPIDKCRVNLSDISSEIWGVQPSDTFLVSRCQVEEMLRKIKEQQKTYQPYNFLKNNCANWVVDRFKILDIQRPLLARICSFFVSTPENVVKNLEQRTLHNQPRVFGKGVWNTYFGDIGFEPPLPANIAEIWNGPCPIWSGGRVCDTHLLVLIPEKVDGQRFSIDLLDQLVQHPKNGGTATHIYKPQQNYSTKDDYDSMKELFSKPAPDSHWVLMPRRVLPNSSLRYYDEQLAMVKELNVKAKASYDVASLLDALTCISLEYVRPENRLFAEKEPIQKYDLLGRVQEQIARNPFEKAPVHPFELYDREAEHRASNHLVISEISSSGPRLCGCIPFFSDGRCLNIGVAVMRIL